MRPEGMKRSAKPTGPKPSNTRAPKAGLHPRNRHLKGYDFAALAKAFPPLRRHVRPNPFGSLSIDYADPEAVKALNRGLLALHYDIHEWDLPEGFLCPPIPGRADYVHHAADLLTADNGGQLPRGAGVRVLDLGTGANLVYPIIGHQEYGWSFVGTEIDPLALDWADALVAANPPLKGFVELRHQPDSSSVLGNILRPGERFELCLCNPPFHASAREAAEGSLRKLRNLSGSVRPEKRLNFGGRSNELWCPGGELTFIRRLINESARYPQACLWFTSLVAKSEHLPLLKTSLEKVGVARQRVIPMAQGQKQSRILAWSYQPENT